MDTTIAFLVASEVAITLLISHLQKDIENSLFMYGISLILSLFFNLMKNDVLEKKGVNKKKQYERDLWIKYSQLDLVSREKSTVDEFQQKLTRASYSQLCIVSWGISSIMHVCTSIIGLIYIIIYINSYEIIMYLVIFNILWYNFVSSKMIKKYHETRSNTKKIRDTNYSLRKLYSLRIHEYENTIDKYTECCNEIDNLMVYLNNKWSQCISFQQLPNMIILLIIPFVMHDKKMYPVIVMVFNNYISSVRSVSSFINRYEEIRSDIECMNDFWKGKTMIKKSIQKEIPDELTIMYNKKIQLTIHKGDRVILQGSSGSGKTTLLKGIAGYIDAMNIDMTVYFDKIVYMKQTIRETILVSVTTIRQLFYDEQDDYLIEQCIEHAYAWDWYSKTMNRKLDIAINNKISGGEKSRLCIAITIYKVIKQDAQWLILDEPEQGLNSELAICIIENIFKTFLNVTIFVATHICDCKIKRLNINKTISFINNDIIVN